MSAPETVMQRALREAEVMTPEDEAWYARWKAAWFRGVAIEYLKSQGVKLIGDSSIVEYAIGRATADVEAAYLLTTQNVQRSPGRPRIGYDVSRIYTAAYFAHADDGISETQRMLAAARFLGHPATKDRVVRGVKAFCRYEALFTSAAYVEHRQAARNFLLNLVVDQKHDLLRIVLTFHCVDQFSLVGQVDSTMPIDAMTVERAANFARFLLRHSLTFYRQNFEPDAATEEGRAFAGYLLTRPDVKTVTHRTLYDARTNLRGQDNLRIRVQILKDLVSAGWLRIAEQGANGPTRCDVNPQVHQRFIERANWERRDREAKRAAIQNAREAKDWLNTDNMSRNPGVFT